MSEFCVGWEVCFNVNWLEYERNEERTKETSEVVLYVKTLF